MDVQICMKKMNIKWNGINSKDVIDAAGPKGNLTAFDGK
jgi:hypothetical protein